MDARDYVRMRSEKRLREGLEGLPGRQQKIGSFERFTKVCVIYSTALELLSGISLSKLSVFVCFRE